MRRAKRVRARAETRGTPEPKRRGPHGAALDPVTSWVFVEALPADQAARNASPPRWLGDSPSGPGDTPLRAGTSTARTGNLHYRTTSFPRSAHCSGSVRTEVNS